MGPLKSSLNWSNFSDLLLWAILYHNLPWSYYYLTHFVVMTFSFNKSWFKEQLVQCKFKNDSADLICYLNTILFIWTLEGDYLSTSVYCLSIYRLGQWNIHSYIILRESQLHQLHLGYYLFLIIFSLNGTANEVTLYAR